MAAFPNLRHVRLFAHAAETGALSRAAEIVRVTQPAASQALSRLEQHFGGALFERRGSGVHLTQRGTVVAQRAWRALDLLRSADQRLQRAGHASRAADVLETHATIAHLRALSAFSLAGGFSAAARRLGQAEPSVHRAAREIERIVAIELFEGRQQAVRLSPTGQALAAAASLLLKELESALEEARELDGRFDGHLVVGTLPLVRTRIVPRAVIAWTGRHPQATIEILDGSYEQLQHGLSTGDIDMLVGALREEGSVSGLSQEVLLEDGLSIIARAGHPLVRGNEIGFDELASHGWVLPRRGTPTRAIFDAVAEAAGFEAGTRGLIETGSLVALRGILMGTDRLSILSHRQIAHEEQAGMLAVVPVRLPPTGRPIGVTTRSGWKPTALQAEFLHALREAAAAE